MKYALASIIVVASLLCSCQSITWSKVTTYDKEGNVVSVTETHESVAATVTKNLKSKTVVVCETGWGLKLSAGSQLESGMTPEFTIHAGKIEGFYGSFLKNVSATDISQIVQAAHNNLTIGPGGVSEKKATESKPEAVKK